MSQPPPAVFSDWPQQNKLPHHPLLANPFYWRTHFVSESAFRAIQTSLATYFYCTSFNVHTHRPQQRYVCIPINWPAFFLRCWGVALGVRDGEGSFYVSWGGSVFSGCVLGWFVAADGQRGIGIKESHGQHSPMLDMAVPAYINL